MACCVTATCLMACSDDEQANPSLGSLVEVNPGLGQANEVFSAEEWYPGGELGTTENASYSAAAPAVLNVAGMEESFNKGEDYFEHLYTITEAPRKGLGPSWTRNSCIACHPNYGHGKRQTQYRANIMGNGYLLVIYHPQAGVDRNGNAYAANSYITEVTGMPQTQAMHPFKAPVDENQISIEWKEVSQMPSGLPMTFADGEQYALIYPEVTIPETAFHTDPIPNNYEVRLESTIGIYGTGLLDAIDPDEMKQVYQEQASQGAKLNPAIWDTDANDWAASAWYTLADGQKKIKKFTYAMTRASLQDGAGANAIWNITNVTRSDRHYLYTTKAWAKAMSQDEEVINYILANGNDKSSVLYPYWASTREEVAQKVNTLL